MSMDDWKQDRLGYCERGENPTLLVKMASGFAVLADSQFLPGYCILLAYPKVNSLNELSPADRSRFLLDMAMLGDAIIETCSPLRLNYLIMGNADHDLHVHIQARYDWEPEYYRSRPAWDYPKEQFFNEKHEFDETEHGELKCDLIKNIKELMRGDT